MSLRPTYTQHDGIRMPKGFPVQGFITGRTYQARSEDIFVSTYPKCGTTWMQNIVWLILHDAEPLRSDQKLTEVIPHLEEVGREFVEALPDPRVIKTHLPFEMTPYHPRARYIYVARNPYDCAVSFYHHTRGFPRYYDFSEGSFGDYFECFVAGKVDFGDYFENVSSWYAHRDDDNVLFLTYEQMQSDVRAAVVAVGDFLGDRGRVVRDEPKLASIIHHSSFETMSQDQDRWSTRRPDGMPAFVRKGVVGDWATHFSSEQAERLAARLEGSELAALWPDLVADARAFT